MPRVSKELLTEMHLKQGLSLSEIGRRLGISQPAVSLARKRFDVPLNRNASYKNRAGRTRGPVVSLSGCLEEVAKMYADGQSMGMISEHYGCSVATVRAALLRIGVVPRTRSEARVLAKKLGRIAGSKKCPE